MKKLGWWWGGRRGGWQTKCIRGDVQMANIQRLMYRAHVLTCPAAMQIYCKKRKCLVRKKEFNLHRTGVGCQYRSGLWTGSLFGERVKKSQGEGREKVRACRQTFGTAILPSCLVIAAHLSARSLSVTWMHRNVINFACKREANIIGNTQLLPCTKMLLFFQWVFSLAGRLCSGGFSFSWENGIFATYFILRGCDLHIDFLRLMFLVGVICRLMQEHSLRLKECISQVPEDTMLKIGRPFYQWLFKSNRMLPANHKIDVNQTCQQSVFLPIGACVRILCAAGAVERQSQMFVYWLSPFPFPFLVIFVPFPQTESQFTC